MATPSFETRLSRLWAHEKASYGLRVFIALAVAMGVCWHWQRLTAVPALFLGAIASAIAETDDNWLGRIKSVLLSLLCFAAAAAAVVLLFPYPLPFVIGMALATFSLTLLGALGERYASIAQATVALSIYAMIGMDQHGSHHPSIAWHGAAALLIGATWYGVLSILWTILFANRPVRERLSRLFFELGRYLKLKADLFEPVRQSDLHARRLALAEQNAKVVGALNAAKTAIMSRFGRSGRPGVQSGLYFRLYYMAQEFHERASSSHYPYEALTDAFFHSDVLYRCQRLLALQGKACAALGEAIRLRHPFDYGDNSRLATEDLRQSLDYLHARADPALTRLLGALELLVTNLQSIERRLSEAAQSDSTSDNLDTRLRDSSPHTLHEMGARLVQQLTPGSVLFRHGLRMAIALLVGYAIMQSIHADNGYWILLTTAFVCRPNYGATRLRLVQRIAGTLIGLVATWALMQLFPGTEVQLLLALAAALVFFITRTDRYMLATAGITVMALFCFNLLGNGFVLIWPRLIDTLIGCAIAAAASFLILPDWQGRRLNQVMATVLASCARYLTQVLEQYASGMRDDLPYRIARRDMHNADAALSVALSNMLREPGRYRRNLDAGFRFLALSNTLLGYLSALGAHRAALEGEHDAAIAQAGEYLQRALSEIASAVGQRQPLPVHDESEELATAEALEQHAVQLPPKQRLVRDQLALTLRLLPKLRAAALAVTTAPAENPPRVAIHKA
ncbi:YccS family putative transporter [Xanthomonas oryzae]|uniref:YccS family putative transporter n=1 Tax=Xanthomonas oryzae TaxID=347 RepID=UPI0003F5E1FB|nr:YccS family putative transporter [Xanthomonas oryzae]AUI89336.1 TIGR01666 family membrane protein [Xanthomonas oryzae pv. oryzae]AUI93012.1 TIGR01666 family membrane protein [Xanthomonas oryzae pv. oryzae]AUI96683.1 TIGR01666 family membrane protein [Xanthomonas oryzae pv. oryzae]AUJ00354.1 TIGR01666 family membrane protein [Xanthomonas oryzae pv. oryzae]AUJ04033.1 TIGR01666 family membrane protein [Xanthomonas oryzae pv. oryzae]